MYKFDLSEISADVRIINLLMILALDGVSELELNSFNSIFIKCKGVRKKVENITFSENEYESIIREDFFPLVQNIADKSSSSPLFEGPLRYTYKDVFVRARFHAVMPSASDFPVITIARIDDNLQDLSSIAQKNSMSNEMMLFLESCVKGKMNIILSGGSGTGKTTLLRAIAKKIPADTRIGVLEDTPELSLEQENVFYLHSSPKSPGVNENDLINLDWVVAQVNRQRCDLIIVGETRGKEFADFITAANSGMDGCMTTIHANDTFSCIDKMSNYALRGNPNLAKVEINKEIAGVINIIVQLGIVNNRHVIKSIDEVTNTVNSDGKITVQKLYSYDVVSNTFVKVGNLSDYLRNLFIERGIDIKRFIGNADKKSIASGMKQQQDFSGLPSFPKIGERII